MGLRGNLTTTSDYQAVREEITPVKTTFLSLVIFKPMPVFVATLLLLSLASNLTDFSTLEMAYQTYAACAFILHPRHLAKKGSTIAA